MALLRCTARGLALVACVLAAVATGGEIRLLDSANDNAGPVILDKSVTIFTVPGAPIETSGNNSIRNNNPNTGSLTPAGQQ